MSRPPLAEIEDILGHQFHDQSVLKQALTHPSLPGEPHYQRLEFLGDRVLGLSISAWLYEQFEREPEGRLNRRFAGLVRQETLADIGYDLEIDRFIRLEEAAAESGTARKPTVLSDVTEALIGALFLDGGFETADTFIRANWAGKLKQGVRSAKDPKSVLQEWAQARHLPTPRYDAIDRTGPDHAPVFTVQVKVEGEEVARATGLSKREAEHSAATMLLERLNSEGRGRS